MNAAKPDGGQPAVLLLCGSFSPVTLSHLKLLEAAKASLQKSGHRVLAGYISPVHDGYKKPGLLPAAVRLDMLRFAVEDSGWVTVDDWECRQPDPSASYKVVEHVKSLLSANADMADAKILFVCGADLARDMENPSKWPVVNRRRLLAACTLAVMAREGTDVVTESYQNEDGEVVQHVLMSSDVIPGSSTLIRELIKEKKPISHLVHPKVEKYIREKCIYTA